MSIKKVNGCSASLEKVAFNVESTNIANDAALEMPFPAQVVLLQDWYYDEEKIRQINETEESESAKFRY